MAGLCKNGLDDDLLKIMTEVVPSPTSSSCARLSSIMLFAAGCDTSTCYRASRIINNDTTERVSKGNHMARAKQLARQRKRCCGEDIPCSSVNDTPGFKLQVFRREMLPLRSNPGKMVLVPDIRIMFFLQHSRK